MNIKDNFLKEYQIDKISQIILLIYYTSLFHT